MLRTLWWLLLLTFLASLATALAVRSTGYTDITAENGRYYLTYRSSRTETTPDEYEQARHRNRVSSVAAATMLLSLFAFTGLESIRFRRARNTRPRYPRPGRPRRS